MQLKKAAILVLMALGVSLSLASLAGLKAISASVGQAGDHDADDDGLIEVSSLEQLNAIRYDLDGDGKADDDSGGDAYAAAFPGAAPGLGCPDAGCTGYELTGDLDFDDPESYGSGSVDKGWSQNEEGMGWPSIGSNIKGFNASFDGNGHTIFNLFIDRQDENAVGLFAVLTVHGEVGQVGLVDVNVTGKRGVGGLVGYNRGSIMGSRAMGKVSGWLEIGMLVGSNSTNITDSYAAGNVSGDWRIGGRQDSYAAGNVSGDWHVGGLVGGIGEP